MFHSEMETIQNFRKLTPEERRKYLRVQTFRELREMEMQRRTRAAEEALERCRREKEERERLKSQKTRAEEEQRRQEAKQREEEKRRALKEKEELASERLRWRKVMMVQEEPITTPRFTLSDLKEQQRRREEVEEAKTSIKSLTSEVREQNRRKTLINNWVGEQISHGETVQEKFRPNSSTHHAPAEKTSLKSKTPTSKPSKALKWLQKRLNSGLFEKKQDEVEIKREACRLKELYGKNRNRLYEQVDSYHMSRNSILKKSFF